MRERGEGGRASDIGKEGERDVKTVNTVTENGPQIKPSVWFYKGLWEIAFYRFPNNGPSDSAGYDNTHERAHI